MSHLLARRAPAPAAMLASPIDMVLVDQDDGWRQVGEISKAEMEELERMHDAGDARAESRLDLLRHGRKAGR